MNRDDLAEAIKPVSLTNWPPNRDSHLIEACKLVPVKTVRRMLPDRWITSLQQNQDPNLKDCCRQAENHDIAAYWTSAAERDRRTATGDRVAPDVYILYCACGCMHRRFCVGGDRRPDGTYERRPFWEVR